MKKADAELLWTALEQESPMLSGLMDKVDCLTVADCKVAHSFMHTHEGHVKYFNTAATVIMFLLVEAGKQIWWPELPTQEEIDSSPHAHLGNIPEDYQHSNR